MCLPAWIARTGPAATHVGGDDLAVLYHLRHHVAVRAAALHVRAQQVASAEVHDAELLHQLCALRSDRNKGERMTESPRAYPHLRCSAKALLVVIPNQRSSVYVHRSSSNETDHYISTHMQMAAAKWSALVMQAATPVCSTCVPFPDPGPPSTKTMLRCCLGVVDPLSVMPASARF